MADGNSPLNMGAPWDAISGLNQQGPTQPGFGQELQRAFAPQQGPAPQRLPGQEELQAALGNMRDFQSRIVQQNQQNEQIQPPATIKVNTSDGTLDLGKVPIATYEAFMRDRQQLDEIRGAFHQEATRLQAQEQQVRQQPWAQLATALSANLANQPDMPGWVRGLGQTAAQLNPTADQLRNQRMAVLHQEAQLAESGTRLNLAAGEAASRELDRSGSKIGAAEKDRKAQVEKAQNNLEQAIKAGPGEIDPAVIAENLTRAGATPQEINAINANLSTLASNVSKKYQTDLAEKQKADALAQSAEDRRNRLATGTLAAQATTAKQKSLEEQGIDAVAQSLANGELTSIKDVASMRGGQRTLIFKRARELNPNFNTGEINRKIKMAESFTVGPDGKALQSFDTFLQHAGELNDTLDTLYQSGSPALNKPMNWIRKNAEGNPEYQKLLVALEPVGKEFEQFLIGGRALYLEDRKQIAELMNGNSSPAQIRSALNQMGKTAKDRFAAMNKRYKGVMGADIEEPFSEEARVAASKIGITLPAGEQPSVSGPAPGARDSGGLHNKVSPQGEITATGQNGEKYVLRNGAWVKQ